jgi:hypothetical protein
VSIGIGESEITSGKSKWESQKEDLDGKGGACAPQDIDILHLSFFRSAREEDILKSEALALVSYSMWGCYTRRISDLPSWEAGFTPPRGEHTEHPLLCISLERPPPSGLPQAEHVVDTIQHALAYTRPCSQLTQAFGLLVSMPARASNTSKIWVGRRGCIFRWQNLRRQVFYSHSH